MAACLLRILTGTDRATVEFAPRPEFGQVHVRLQTLPCGLLVLGSNEPIALYSPGVNWEIFRDGDNESARALVDLTEMDGAAVLELRLCTNHLGTPGASGLRTAGGDRGREPGLVAVAETACERPR